jgi:hypothetical protein
VSLYQVDKLLFQLFNDLELQDKYRRDADAVLKRFDLQEHELKALREVNAGDLYRMGAHSFLLWQFSRLMDLKPAVYFKQVRGE